MTNNTTESLDLILYKLTALEHRFQELESRFEELDDRLAKIENYLQRQKGFIGGILFIGSCITWLVSYLKDWWK